MMYFIGVSEHILEHLTEVNNDVEPESYIPLRDVSETDIVIGVIPIGMCVHLNKKGACTAMFSSGTKKQIRSKEDVANTPLVQFLVEESQQLSAEDLKNYYKMNPGGEKVRRGADQEEEYYAI